MSSSSKLVRTVALIATGHLILPCHETLELQKKIYQPHTFWRELKFQIFPPKNYEAFMYKLHFGMFSS